MIATSVQTTCESASITFHWHYANTLTAAKHTKQNTRRYIMGAIL